MPGLFGRNRESALIAEDDHSGMDTDARISADRIAGDHFAPVRPYDRASGMGNRSIVLRKR